MPRDGGKWLVRAIALSIFVKRLVDIQRYDDHGSDIVEDRVNDPIFPRAESGGRSSLLADL
jgi:hypothetical protein